VPTTPLSAETSGAMGSLLRAEPSENVESSHESASCSRSPLMVLVSALLTLGACVPRSHSAFASPSSSRACNRPGGRRRNRPFSARSSQVCNESPSDPEQWTANRDPRRTTRHSSFSTSVNGAPSTAQPAVRRISRAKASTSRSSGDVGRPVIPLRTSRTSRPRRAVLSERSRRVSSCSASSAAAGSTARRRIAEANGCSSSARRAPTPPRRHPRRRLGPPRAGRRGRLHRMDRRRPPAAPLLARSTP
jgi:hypothetical protein